MQGYFLLGKLVLWLLLTGEVGLQGYSPLGKLIIIIIMSLLNCPSTGTRSMGIWEDHIQEKRTLVTSGMLTENGQVAFNICALIFSSLLKMFSCFRNIFYTKSASFMLSSWFSWTSNLCMMVLLIVCQ